MLLQIIDLISQTNTNKIEGAISCKGITIDSINLPIIEYLENEDAIENSDYEKNLGFTIDLELSLARLRHIGYYEDATNFLIKFRYKNPSMTCYIADIKQFSDDSISPFFQTYCQIIDLIDALKSLAKHVYEDSDGENIIIFKDERSLLIPLAYTSTRLLSISDSNLIDIREVVMAFNDHNSEKKSLFINELIEMLSNSDDRYRFSNLLKEISEYNDRCINAYQYYLRDYSYNKLKIELDTKALDFTQKIQTVINDSQTKLIAIPAAFVLVFSTFDFNDPHSLKDILAIIGLLLFAVIIQQFLNNQFSSLKFTERNIESYKATFKNKNMSQFLERFQLVDSELGKQRLRLNILTVLLWFVPLSLGVIWLIILK